MYVNFTMAFTGCNISGNKINKLELNPVLNKIYNYSFTKTSVMQWAYNDTAYTKYDTILLNFSMQKINNSNGLITFKII